MKTWRVAAGTMMTSGGSSHIAIPIGTTENGAVTETYEYRLGKRSSGMSDKEKEQIQERFDELRDAKRPMYDAKVRTKEMSENEAAAALMHEVLEHLAGEFRVGYCRVLKRTGFQPELP